MTTPIPQDVLARRRSLVLDHDLNGFADLFATDGVLELPFAPPGMPTRIEGREAIRAFSTGASITPMRVEDMWTTAVYQTTDPEVLIVEVASRAVVTATGVPFETTSVQVFRIQDGEIRLFRDYWNPQSVAQALNA